jgi:hypothetical protein
MRFQMPIIKPPWEDHGAECQVAFMRPWVELLLEHLTDEPNPSEGEHLTVATFRCWTDERDELEEPYVPLHEKFYVRFPADHANRVRQTRCQRIREALELLDMVSAVNNAAFSEMMDDQQVTEVQVEIGDDSEKETLVVCPLWVCYLLEPLDDDDPVASMPAVSWGRLFGCPKNPVDYSLLRCSRSKGWGRRKLQRVTTCMERSNGGLIARWCGCAAPKGSPVSAIPR